MLSKNISRHGLRVSHSRAVIIRVAAVFAAVLGILSMHWRATLFAVGAIALWTLALWTLALIDANVNGSFMLLFAGCLLWAGALIGMCDA
jgi:hypothetical protein